MSTPAVISQTFDPAIPIGKLKEHPDNPRRGRDDLVGDSIEATGFYGAVIVHKRTRHVLAGNTRFRAMKEKGAATIPGLVVSCDDATARRIMLADNRTSDLAVYDDELLVGLLREVQAAGGLDGTGYSDEALAALLAAQDVDVDLAPDAFPTMSPDDLDVEYRCPSCHYEWSGSPRPGEPVHEPTA